MYSNKEKLIMEDDHCKATWESVSTIINNRDTIKNLCLGEALKLQYEFKLMTKHLDSLSYSVQRRIDDLEIDEPDL